MTKRQGSFVFFLVGLMMVHANLVFGQTASSYTTLARIEQSSVSDLGSKPLIASYDLSPDAKTIALLLLASSQTGAPLWLVTEDIAEKRVVSKIDLGPSKYPGSGFALQVFYASDHRYLIVQDLQQIRVFDANSLKLMRIIAGPSTQPIQPPLFVLVASRADVAICAFGSAVPPEFGVHTTAAYLEAINLVSGKLLGEWTSDDVPQAISPNGKLIAISSSHPEKGVLPLNIFDIAGNKVAELDGGFAFRKTANPITALGRVRGLFVGNEEVLLSPDGNVDRTGHHSGNSLQIVSVSNKALQQEFKPGHYGPTGEMAISEDESTIVVVSWDLSAGVYRNEEASLPVSSSPEVLLFRRKPRLSANSGFQIHGLGLNLSGWLQNRRPSVSSDGSVIAIAQDSGVTVFANNPTGGHRTLPM